MSTSKRTTNRGRGRPRRISVRALRRDQPDIARLGRALVALALAQQAEADAQAEHAAHEAQEDTGAAPGAADAATAEESS